MATVLITESYLDGIANAIRRKNGTNNVYYPSQMEQAIDDIPETGILIQKSVMQNGVYNASSDNADGYSRVVVVIPVANGEVF